MPAQDSIDVLINYFNQLIALSKEEKDFGGGEGESGRAGGIIE